MLAFVTVTLVMLCLHSKGTVTKIGIRMNILIVFVWKNMSFILMNISRFTLRINLKILDKPGNIGNTLTWVFWHIDKITPVMVRLIHDI
jgi:hypothetical protein